MTGVNRAVDDCEAMAIDVVVEPLGEPVSTVLEGPRRQVSPVEPGFARPRPGRGRDEHGVVGRRPIIIDRDILRGVAIILETYCPDELKHYQDAIKDLKTDDTTDL